MASPVTIWIDSDAKVRGDQILKLLKVQTRTGSLAYKKVNSAKDAKILVLPDGASPPVVFDPARQQAVYKIWVEHVVAENEPIEVTRRYEVGFAAFTAPHRPVVARERKSNILDSDSYDETESSTAESEEMASKSKKQSKPIKKASTVPGIVSTPSKATSSAPESNKSPSSKATSATKSKQQTPPPRAANKSATTPTPPNTKTNARKEAVARLRTELSPPPAKRARKQVRHDDTDDDDDMHSYTASGKTKQRRSSMGAISGSETATAKRVTAASTRPKRFSLGSTSGPKAKAEVSKSGVFVYLAQSTEEEKMQYRNDTPGKLLTYVLDVGRATHVVMCKREISSDDPIPLSVVYAIARAKWVVKRDWLDDAIATNSLPSEVPYEVTELPGCRMARVLHAARDKYLQEHGILPQHADDSRDSNMPRLLFSGLTFHIDRLKAKWSRDTMAQVQEIILANGGHIGGESNSDIWLTKDAYTEVYDLVYGEVGAPPDEDLRLRHQNPHWRKRHFVNFNTHAHMDTYAIPFDFIRDSLINGVTADPTHYRNLLKRLVGL